MRAVGLGQSLRWREKEKDEERPKEDTIREARGCRERCAWKAEEGERGKSIPYL